MKPFYFTIFIITLALSTTKAQVIWSAQSYEVDQGSHIEGTSQGADMAIDQDNNVYITGEYDGEIRFDTTLLPDDFGSVYMAKYKSNGDFGWVRKVTGNSNNKGLGAAVNDSGHVYFTGEYTHTNSFTKLDFGNIQLTGNLSTSTYLAKADTAGNFLWAIRMLAVDNPGTQFVRPFDMQVADNGDIIVVGEVKDTVMIEGQAYNTENGPFNMMFLARFKPDGKLDWFRHTDKVGNGSNIFPAKIMLGSQGQIYANGKLGGKIIWDADTIQEPLNSGGGGLYIARFSGGGDLEWWQTATSRTANQFPNDFGVDFLDNVYLTFRKAGRIYFQDMDFFPPPELKGSHLLLKFDQDGNRQYYKSIGHMEEPFAGGIQEQVSVHTQNDGRTFIVGEFGGFGSYMVFGDRDTFPVVADPNFVRTTQFIAAFDHDGDYLDTGFWVEESLTANSADETMEPQTLLTDSNGDMVLSGQFHGILKLFGTDTLNTTFVLDQMFIAKLDPDLMFDFTTSIDDLETSKITVKVYPNPASDWIRIEMEDEVLARNAIVQLYTLGGVLVNQSKIQEEINVQHLPSGTYMLVVRSEGKAFGKKVTVRH